MAVDLRPKTVRQKLAETRPAKAGGTQLEVGGLPIPEGMRFTGFEDDNTKKLMVADHYLRKGGMPSLKPLLPLMLALKGKPYRLDRYFPFEPFFRTRIPKMVLLKTGRQVSKSTSLAAQGVVFSNSIPFFSTLYVTPLYEMIRRFSHNYVRRFIEESPVRKLLTGSKASNNVLQRSFKNAAQMLFSFAYLDAERTRGISADKNVVDEVQDMNIDFLPIIHETMSGSEDWGLIQYAGTPKSLDNTIESLWQDSSMAEWVIKCHHGGCGHYNIPALQHDLIAMIGPPRPDISEDRPGVVCAKCRKPIDPRRMGRWVHSKEQYTGTDKKVHHPRWDFAGYHVPQLVMPMHYGNHEKWTTLWGKMNGRGNTTTNVFMNEVCGESYDTGSKLVTVTDLKQAACLPWENRADEAVKNIGEYMYRVCAVDWGGGGEKMTSYTVVVVLGITPDGKIDVIWGNRVLKMLDYEYEANLICSAIRHFRCSHFAHDYGTSGGGREVLIRQAGFPMANIVPIRYAGNATQNIMLLHDATEKHPRFWYSLDRSRALVTVCHAIRSGLIRTFRYDYKGTDDPGLLHDFLALMEEKTDSRTGSDLYAIVRNPNFPDDFAHACTYGACTLWYLSGSWPRFAEATKFEIPLELLEHVSPVGQVNWEDVDV